MNMVSRFLPWVRQSTFAGNSLAVRAAGLDVTVPVSRYGPGDVTGIAPREIRRRDPLPGSLAMPPNLLPAVEFNTPDFPWMISPAAPDPSGQLQPWLALITVEVPAGDPLGHLPQSKLPVIEVPRNELPPPSELKLWAHVQLDETGPATADVIRRGVSRVVSPRALLPSRRYLVCLVPTFEAGRLAGLGQTVADARSTALAWSAGEGKVMLPVYDSWSFTTAESGDLETIARRIQGCDLKAFTRPKLLDVSRVSGNMAGKLAPLEGALRPFNSNVTWTGPAVTASAAKIRPELEHTLVGGVPVVGLPVYGSIASGESKPLPGWLSDLNLDPRRRVAAGLGADLVRQHQEDLVDEAWRQAGDIQRARQEREGAVLADVATARLYARMMAPLSGSNAVVAMAPALARTRDTVPGNTMAARVAASVVPGPVLDAGFRRILAVKAPLAARKAGQGIRRSVAMHNTLTFDPSELPWTSWKCVTRKRIEFFIPLGRWIGEIPANDTPPITLPPLGSVIGAATLALEPLNPGVPATASELAVPEASSAQDFATATTAPPSGDAAALAAVTTSLPTQETITAFLAEQATRLPSVVQVFKPAALAWPEPVTPPGPGTAITRFTRRMTLGDRARLSEATGVQATPHFTQPLAAWLDAGWLLSGIDVPPDAAGLLETNAAFIEALIVGSNHELARELLWRGVPLARNSTLMTRFFEARASSAPPDIKPLSDWSAAEALSSHIAVGERCVMILRSPLVSRLSQTSIFLTNAVADGTYRKPGTTQILPLFRGFAGPDTAYFGFDLTPEALATEPGYYFVIQELSGAPRFGLDETATTAFNTWNDLAWPHVAVSGGYIVAATKKPVPAQPKGLEWAKDSAHMAAIVKQRPLRLSIHTSLLMPK